jgi:putative ABC transport system ATP-binding protein
MGETRINALSGVNLSVRSGDLLCLIGPSGSGKTTLLNIIGCLDKPTSGKVILDGEDVTRFKEGKLSSIRLNKFGYIFQQFYLLPNLNSLQNVYLPIKESSGLFSTDGKRRAYELLEKVGMANRIKHLPTQLSGGEQQRVAIARALANDPSVILADEPTGELDSDNSKIIMDILRDLNRDMGRSIIIVTHDPEIARKTKRVIKMKDGRVQ